MTTIKDIIHTRGDTYEESFVFSPATNISGSTILFTIKREKDDINYILQKTATLTNSAIWAFTISATATEMELLDIADYYYDIEWTTSIWKVTTLRKWKFISTYDITN